MDYIKYEKSFVMMEGQNDDFALRPESPVKGHIKIETGNNKGAMRIGVQNLRYFDKKDYVYKLIFFGSRAERTIHVIIGTVSVNKFGSGETYFRFDPRDLEGKGYPLSHFYHAIVAAVSVRNEKEALHPVLKGTLELPRREEEGTQHNGRRVAAESEAATVKAAGLEQTEETGEGNPSAPVPKAELEPEPKSELQLNSKGGNPREKKEPEPEPEPIQTEAFHRECYNNYYNHYLLEHCRRIGEKGDHHDEIRPFNRDLTGATWRKIINVNNLPLISPMARYFSTKYRHYIFGSDENRWYFGVPGRFLKEEQPEGGMSGFVFWQPIAGAEKLGAMEQNCPEENRKTAYGYWIVSVDKETGDILEV